MLTYSANITPKGVIEWPMHTHKFYEVMYYLSGEGMMQTDKKTVPFAPNTFIIVPPGIHHGSTSEKGFRNISISSESFSCFPFSDVVSFTAGDRSDGAYLAEMLLRFHDAPPTYAVDLLTAFADFILEKVSNPFTACDAVLDFIRERMEENYRDPNFCVTDCLKSCGYAEDYIRARFRERFHVTPVSYLTRLRIRYAERLCEIFGASRSVGEIAYLSGFSDEVYFSKVFKRYVGVSPSKYRKEQI